jgi:hypothetical protein
VPVHGDSSAQCLGEQCERSGDAVCDAEVRVPAGETVGLRGVGVVEGPPAGYGVAVDAQRLGEEDQVGQDSSQGVAAGGVMQEVCADPGQAMEQVVLGEGRGGAAVDAAWARLIRRCVSALTWVSILARAAP